jgi:hypothetical protein
MSVTFYGTNLGADLGIEKDTVYTAINPLQAADALNVSFISKELATIIFCCGLIGMSCAAISAHMTCCGFVWCEMLGLEQTKWRFRLFALTPAVGVAGVVFELPLWFPIAASAICLTMVPVAFLIFLILSNKRSYIGDAVGKGPMRWIFNGLLIITLVVATIGAMVKIKTGVFDELIPSKPAVVQSVIETK